MNGLVEFALKGAVAPAAMSFAVYWLSRRMLHEQAAARYAAAVGFAAGFCTGFLLLGTRGDLTPVRHWQWTLYLAVGASALGPIASAKGLVLPERWLLVLMGAFGAAWALVPNWASLQPPRGTLVPLLSVYLLLLAAALEPLLERLPAARVLALLAAAAACVAALVAALVSLTFAQLIAASAAALAGCSLAAWISRDATARGVGLAYAVVVGGWAFIGGIEPREPLVGMLIAPYAPLSLWFCVRGPLARARGWGVIAIQAAMVLLVLAIATVVVVF